MKKTVILLLGLIFAVSLSVPLTSNAQTTRLSDDEITADDGEEDAPSDSNVKKENKSKKKGKKGKKSKKAKNQDNKK